MGWELAVVAAATIGFALHADLPHAGTMLSATYATVALSVLLHGVTAAPLVRRYASWFGSHPAENRPAKESVPAETHRLRGRFQHAGL
jgi:sodium/hydrogen antiporter